MCLWELIVGHEGSVAQASQAWCTDDMKEDKIQAISIDAGEKGPVKEAKCLERG